MGTRGWEQLDVVLITGDAYVDHPSYGVAVIGRCLESKGYRVGIIAQPDWRNAEDFKKLGRPRLFFGITSGNVDSMVANYTANKKPRRTDDYSPGGKAGLRPDRAVIVYANRAREAYPGVAVVLGGVESSLRRFAHYDHWDNSVRRSILLDAKADMLVYGMGERAIMELAERMARGEAINTINGIRGTVAARKDLSFLKEYDEIHSYEETKNDKNKFNAAFKGIYHGQNPYTAKIVAQKHGDRYVVQFPPALPLSEKEMDAVYALPYAYAWHPVYEKEGGIKAFETVRFSITSHRGCCAECAFCGIHMHQGRIVQSRSRGSILSEAAAMSRRRDFKGTITDIGGPTANMYGAKCGLWGKKGFCRDKSCLLPEKCANLELAYGESIKLYEEVRNIPKVKHVFIGSGFRYDLLNDKYADKYLEKICLDHISGQMKVAPEHIVDKVLKIMNKSPRRAYEAFLKRVDSLCARTGKKIYLVNYFISAHPGSSLKDALEMALYLAKRHMHPEQIQDFIPLPMTLSGCIYYTGRHPLTGEEIYVPAGFRERKMQRALMQYANPSNRALVEESLKELDAEHLRGLLAPARKGGGTRAAKGRAGKIRGRK